MEEKNKQWSFNPSNNLLGTRLSSLWWEDFQRLANQNDSSATDHNQNNNSCTEQLSQYCYQVSMKKMKQI